MSAELMQSLATQGITTKEAAQQIGMPYHQFRALRDMYPHIKWGLTKRALDGLASRRKSRLTKRQVEAIRADDRPIKVIAEAHGISKQYASNIRNGRQPIV